ncbi:hypothetical protein AAFN64_17580, partial [Flavobacterium sp. CAU 1735]
GNSLNYTFRMHDSRTGRFFARDPLERDYTWNSPYAFSENRVMDAVELEGLEAFFVTGTSSTNKRWAYPNDQLKRDETLIHGILKYTTNVTYNDKFNWNEIIPHRTWYGRNTTRERNYTFNNEADRAIAARNLVRHIFAARMNAGIDKMNKDGSITYGDTPITLIGHSHGGNVSIQAARLIYKQTGIKVDLITIATPTYEGSSIENPNNESIAHHLHIYNRIDGVQGGLAGGERYTNDKTVNLQLQDVTKHYDEIEWMDAHSYDNNFMGEFLKDLNNTLHNTFQTKDGVKRYKSVEVNPNFKFYDDLYKKKSGK